MLSSAREKLIYAYYFGFVLIAVGLPLSKFLVSVGQFFLLGAWLLSSNPLVKIKLFFNNKIALACASLFLLHITGLAYTTDFAEATRDLRIKIPIFLLPLILSSSAHLTSNHIKKLMWVFCAAVLTKTLIAFYKINFTDIVDLRQATGSLSHIRLSLMICLAIVFLLQQFKEQRLISGGLLIWLFAFLFILQSVAGLIIAALLIICYINYWAFKNKKTLTSSLAVLFNMVIITVPFYFVTDEYKKFYTPVNQHDIKSLEQFTVNGNKYEHDTSNKDLENGHYLAIYNCWEEMEKQWDKRSIIKSKEKDKKGNRIDFTLHRYLTSKGLRKDSAGVNALSAIDVQNIENGISNIAYADIKNIRSRIHDIIFEFDKFKQGKDASGHSVTQRVEFLKTAFSIISKNIFIGVGTGDMAIAFKQEYENNGTLLKTEFRLRAHNQFVTMMVSFGIIGFAIFIFTMYYPLTIKRVRENKMYLAFIVIITFSMLSEDTFETQAGVTFFAFFNSLYLFAKREEEQLQ
jgi:hypothetical protein